MYPPNHFYSGGGGGPGGGPGGGVPGGGGGGGGGPTGFPGGPRPSLGPQSPHLAPGKMAPLGGMNMNQANMMSSRLGGPMGGGGGGGAADDGEPKVCAGCGVRIVEKTMLHSMDRYWHEACLRCSCCGTNLADSASCFMKSGMILCKQDYVR